MSDRVPANTHVSHAKLAHFRIKTQLCLRRSLQASTPYSAFVGFADTLGTKKRTPRQTRGFSYYGGHKQSGGGAM
jgi:hypothetical protein